MSLEIVLGERAFANPVLTAAGCGGSGAELARYTDLAALGGFVSRTLSLDPRTGPDGPRHAETPSGLVVEASYENPGLHSFLATGLPPLLHAGVTPVISVIGRSLGDYAELARRAGGAPGVAALEVVFPDPGMDAHAAGKALAAVRRDTPRGVAVLAKIDLVSGPDLVTWAGELVRNGADALVVGHGPRALALDPGTLRPLVRGRLSGPALLPLTLETVSRLHAVRPGVPLVAVGGIRSGRDALLLMAAGASAVQVGSAILHDPTAPARVLAELTTELDRRGLTAASVVGAAGEIDPAVAPVDPAVVVVEPVETPAPADPAVAPVEPVETPALVEPVETPALVEPVETTPMRGTA